MTTDFKKGDKVEWQTTQGKTTGTITEVLTQPTTIKTHFVAASIAHPEFLVKSDKTGKLAAHKPTALIKIK